MTENEEKQKKTRIPNRNSMRNMRQYSSMSDDEFNTYYEKVVLNVDKDELIKERYDRIMRQYEEEYDLSELLPNDRMTLSNLIDATIQLEDYMSDLRECRKDGVSFDNIALIKELNDACSKLRKDISLMQDDLKITRKTRKSEKEQSVLNFVEDLKAKAKQFAHEKMRYIFCEKCGQLLATVWYQSPETKGNDIRVECKHKLEDGTVCGWSKKFSAKELFDKHSSNREELLPESMK